MGSLGAVKLLESANGSMLPWIRVNGGSTVHQQGGAAEPSRRAAKGSLITIDVPVVNGESTGTRMRGVDFGFL